MKNKRLLFLTTLALAVAVGGALALAARAQQGRLATLPAEATTKAEAGANLRAPIAPPEAVFIQRTSSPHGNVIVTLQLGAEQVGLKQAEGTGDFILVGEGELVTAFRDDGVDPDRTAGDGRFTGLATIDDAELAARADHDQTQIAERRSSSVPVFAGRRFDGFATAEPFDYESFLAGAEVEIDAAVSFLSDGSVASSEPTASAEALAGQGKSAPRRLAAANVTPGTNTFQERVLMIRNPAVVQDPSRTWNPCTGAGNQDGVWTFKHLITEMANQPLSGIDPAAFAEDWLETWTLNPGPTINGTTVSTRSQMFDLIDEWKNGAQQVDLRVAPLRLLAIVPRVDLATTTGGGGYSGRASGNFLDAGELRFVFGVVLPPGFDTTGFIGASPIQGAPGCFSLPFSVIFEYKVPKCDCEEVRDWARRLVQLAGFVPGSSTYNGRLAALTQTVVRANADPRRPNGNSLGQLRTNEIALPQDAPTPLVRWELREFQLTQKPFSLLVETTTADTAADPFNFTPTFSNWILNEVRPAIQAQFNGPIPPVSLFFQGGPFLGADPQVPSTAHHWNGVNLNGFDILTNEARHRASLAACNACHANETDTVFVHVDPSSPTLPATISGFLSGINDVADPAFNIPLRDFDDLARREIDIQQVANMTCGRFPIIDIGAVQAHFLEQGVLIDDPFLPPQHEEGGGHHHKALSASVDAMRRNHISDVH